MKYGRRDECEAAIVQALQDAGCQVWTHLPADLLVYRAERFFVLECKTGTRAPRASQSGQKRFLRVTNCPIVRNAEQALRAVEVITPDIPTLDRPAQSV